MECAVAMTGVGKRFGSHWAVAGMTGAIRRGEAVGLFGGNGSGKSTLLKMIATLLAPSAGRLALFGCDAAGDGPGLRRRLRFLAHEKQLYGALTVAENLRLAAGLRGLPRRAGAAAIDAALDRLALAPVRGRLIAHCSEGMRKRVALARLLLGDGDPELILLDEPHPTLDQEGKAVLDTLIGEWRLKGAAILLASHDHDRALRHVDRLLVLEDGRIAYDGAPR